MEICSLGAGVQDLVSTVADLMNEADAVEVLGELGVQEESDVHGEEIQENQGTGAGWWEVGGVMRLGGLQVQKLFAKYVDRSLTETWQSTWQSSMRTFHSGENQGAD